MQTAIKQAHISKDNGDYAIGAVVVKNGKVLAEGLNRSKSDDDATSHSEIVAIRGASKIIGSRHLKGCVLYTTHEPCSMCTSAAIWARLDGIVFGSRKNDMAEYASLNANKEWSWRTIDITASEIIAKSHPKLFLIQDFMRAECNKLFHS